MRTLLAAVSLVLMVAPCSPAQENAPPTPNMPRPIDARDSVWIEELTWLEVRDAIRAGKTIAIVPTEQDIWSYDYLGSLGILQKPDVKSSQRGLLHDDYHYESIVATVDPRHIRLDERKRAGLASIYGFSVDPIETTIANGKKLIEYRTALTAAAITKAVAQP